MAALKVSEIIAGVGIHLVTPALGLAAYVKLCRTMARSGAPNPPYLSFFILFANYGGCLLVLLTSLFWVWSGMASLGTFYLVLVSPVISGFLAWSLFGQRFRSPFHHMAFVASFAYIGLILGGTLVSLCIAFWLR